MNYYKVTPSATGEYIRSAMRTSRYQIEIASFETSEEAEAAGYKYYTSARHCMGSWDLSFLGAPAQILVPTPKSLSFTDAASTKTIFVSTTEDTYAVTVVESGASWCTVSQDGELVSVAVTANAIADARTATVKLTAGEVTVLIPVTQDGTSA